jgi:hypothetical protein
MESLARNASISSKTTSLPSTGVKEGWKESETISESPLEFSPDSL